MNMKIMSCIPLGKMRSDSYAGELLTGRKLKVRTILVVHLFNLKQVLPLWITS